VRQLDRIKSYVGFARDEGATVLSGGESPQLEGGLENGYFFPAYDLQRR